MDENRHDPRRLFIVHCSLFVVRSPSPSQTRLPWIACQALAAASLFLALGCSSRGSSPMQPEAWRLDPPLSVADEVAASQAVEDAGPRLYQHYCALCHGHEGKGDGQYYSDSLGRPPANLTASASRQPLTEAHVTGWIQKGSAGAGKPPLCPPWQHVFSEAECTALARHVSRLAAAP